MCSRCVTDWWLKICKYLNLQMTFKLVLSKAKFTENCVMINLTLMEGDLEHLGRLFLFVFSDTIIGLSSVNWNVKENLWTWVVKLSIIPPNYLSRHAIQIFCLRAESCWGRSFIDFSTKQIERYSQFSTVFNKSMQVITKKGKSSMLSQV